MILKKLFTILLITIFAFIFPSKVLPMSENINATIRIAVCGNDVLERGEDCEINLGVTQSCEDFGLIGGLLQCDNSCAFDILQCEIPVTKQQENTTTPLPITYENPLPILLRPWDSNGDNILQFEELKSFINSWFKSWNLFRTESAGFESCDVNRDGICDIYDFSVILFHTN